MTREEFVKKHADDFLGRLMRAAHTDKTTALYARWLAIQVEEVDGWLGKLHDTLTEMKNAQEQKQPQGQPGAPGPASPPAKSAPARGPAGLGRGAT